MKPAVIGGVIIILVLVAAGIFMFRPVDAPDGSLLPVSPLADDPEFVPASPVVSPASPFAISPAASPSPSVGTVAASPTAVAPTISITDTGFSPATLTVAAGTTVTFVNNGQAPHWPASDPHPTHTALAGFDAKRGLQTGETYSFTFAQAGTWGYHDHLNAQLTGSVTVQ